MFNYGKDDFVEIFVNEGNDTVGYYKSTDVYPQGKTMWEMALARMKRIYDRSLRISKKRNKGIRYNCTFVVRVNDNRIW